jgi:catechol 2,3-dioxygenase-like lactoylglutathione lyase family enzyme
MIGRMHHVVLDCPDPPALATFYSSLLGLPVTYHDDAWVPPAVGTAHFRNSLTQSRDSA